MKNVSLGLANCFARGIVMKAESLSQEATFHKHSMLCTVGHCWGYCPFFSTSLHKLYHWVGSADTVWNSGELAWKILLPGIRDIFLYTEPKTKAGISFHYWHFRAFAANLTAHNFCFSSSRTFKTTEPKQLLISKNAKIFINQLLVTTLNTCYCIAYNALNRNYFKTI